MCAVPFYAFNLLPPLLLYEIVRTFIGLLIRSLEDLKGGAGLDQTRTDAARHNFPEKADNVKGVVAIALVSSLSVLIVLEHRY